MISLLLAAALTTTPVCVPSGQGYLPTPSPCRVEIVDPFTHRPETLALRFLVDKPTRLKPGRWPLHNFYPDRRRHSRWRWALFALLL